MNLLLYAVLTFAPAGSFIAFAKALEWWTQGNGATKSGTQSPGPEIERLLGDLRRLECDYCRIERSGLPRSATAEREPRLRRHPVLMLRGARDPAVGSPPFNGVQRLEMEASLAQRGVTL